MPADWKERLEHSEYVEVDGVDTHYFDMGEGDPLYLVHGGGLPSCAELNWGAVLEPLSEECRVIAADQPGFGFTPSRGEQDYDPRERADFMLEMLEELGLEGVTVCGNSRAGFQVMYMGLTRPDIVSKVIIVNAGSASRYMTDEEMPGNLAPEPPKRENMMEDLKEARESLVNYDQHPFWSDPLTEEKAERYFEIRDRNWEFTNNRNDAIQNSPEAYNEILSYDGEHISKKAHLLELPTLITWSTAPYPGWPPTKEESESGEMEQKLATIEPERIEPYERDEGFEMGVKLFQNIESSELHVWHDSKHHVMTDHARRWADVVADFVTSES
jgi:pimeloyl-ACP methyl ester carboxylesterase